MRHSQLPSTTGSIAAFKPGSGPRCGVFCEDPASPKSCFSAGSLRGRNRLASAAVHSAKRLRPSQPLGEVGGPKKQFPSRYDGLVHPRIASELRSAPSDAMPCSLAAFILFHSLPVILVVPHLCFKVYRLVVQLSPIRIQNDSGHVVGMVNAELIEILRQSRPTPESPIVPYPSA